MTEYDIKKVREATSQDGKAMNDAVFIISEIEQKIDLDGVPYRIAKTQMRVTEKQLLERKAILEEKLALIAANKNLKVTSIGLM